MSDEPVHEMPPTWWSPSQRTWFSQDREGEYYEIYSEEAILELPADAVELQLSATDDSRHLLSKRSEVD